MGWGERRLGVGPRRAGVGSASGLGPGLLLLIGVLAAGNALAGSMPADPAMQMGDTQWFGRVLLDQLEWRRADSHDAAAWDAEGWYGGDRDRLWLRTEGERSGAHGENARGELLWGHAIGSWWDLQAGARVDFDDGPPRRWAALGLEGLAPYWLEIEATVYLGEEGRTAARLKAEYDLLLTQRLILQPEVEANLYGKRDLARGIGSGLADFEAGLRLRYEIRREIAPYVGVAWVREAGLAPAPGEARSIVSSEARVVAGLRAWL